MHQNKLSCSVGSSTIQSTSIQILYKNRVIIVDASMPIIWNMHQSFRYSTKPFQNAYLLYLLLRGQGVTRRQSAQPSCPIICRCTYYIVRKLQRGAKLSQRADNCYNQILPVSYMDWIEQQKKQKTLRVVRLHAYFFLKFPTAENAKRQQMFLVS